MVVGFVGCVSPDAVRLRADDGLDVFDAEGELPPTPGAGGDHGIDPLGRVGADDVVGGCADSGLQCRDVGVARCGGRVAVVRADDRAARVPASGAAPHAAAVRLRARSAGAGVAFDGLNPAAVVGLDDADMVGDPVVVPVETDQVSGRGLRHRGDESAFAGGGVDAVGHVGEVAAGDDGCAVVAGQAPGREHCTERHAGRPEIRAMLIGVPAAITGAFLWVVPSGVADLACGPREGLACGHGHRETSS